MVLVSRAVLWNEDVPYWLTAEGLFCSDLGIVPPSFISAKTKAKGGGNSAASRKLCSFAWCWFLTLRSPRTRGEREGLAKMPKYQLGQRHVPVPYSPLSSLSSRHFFLHSFFALLQQSPFSCSVFSRSLSLLSALDC